MIDGDARSSLRPAVADDPDTGSFVWRGPGRTGFLVPCSSDRVSASGRDGPIAPLIHSVADARSVVDGRLTPSQESAFEDFFQASGSACRLVVTSRPPEYWLGEDAGPGERSGLHAFRDVADVGSIVTPPVPASRIDAFLRFAEQRPELFFFMPEARRETIGAPLGSSRPDSKPGLSCVSSNVALLREPVPPGLSAARLAGWCEGDDYRPWRRRSRVSARASGPPAPRPSGREQRDAGWALSIPDEIRASLRSWRLEAGLRRSLDHGSRWIVFDANHALVRRRLEREVRAFLHDLSLEGILPPWGGDGLEVRCEPAPGEGDAPHGKVCLTVRLRLKEERW